jgi:hypothetical protein
MARAKNRQTMNKMARERELRERRERKQAKKDQKKLDAAEGIVHSDDESGEESSTEPEYAVDAGAEALR